MSKKPKEDDKIAPNSGTEKGENKQTKKPVIKLTWFTGSFEADEFLFKGARLGLFYMAIIFIFICTALWLFLATTL